MVAGFIGPERSARATNDNSAAAVVVEEHLPYIVQVSDSTDALHSDDFADAKAERVVMC